MNVVLVKELGFAYGLQAALQNVNLEVPEGLIYGLIGPDSAGKTTLIRAICTLLPYKQGMIEVLGRDALKNSAAIRAQIGYMPQRFSLYKDLSVEQNLEFFGRLFGVNSQTRGQNMEKLYRFSHLKPFAKRLAGNLSGGMQQKLALSCALIHTPSLIVLDEPTFGVDPVSRMEFWSILHSLKQEGISILVSTPYMDEAEQCDLISLIDKGQIIGQGSPADILAAWNGWLYRLKSSDLQNLYRFLKAQSRLDDLQLFGSEIHLGSDSQLSDSLFINWQRQCPCLEGWEQIQPSMEDAFLKMMK